MACPSLSIWSVNPQLVQTAAGIRLLPPLRERDWFARVPPGDPSRGGSTLRGVPRVRPHGDFSQADRVLGPSVDASPPHALDYLPLMLPKNI